MPSTTTQTQRTPLFDATHDPQRRSWIESANEHEDFPIQNLPLGVFRRMNADGVHGESDAPRIGVAIGDLILDLHAAVMLHEQGEIDQPLLTGLDAKTRRALCATSLNMIMAQGRSAWRSIRHAVGKLLDADEDLLRDQPKLQERVLLAQRDVEMTLPAVIGDYTDFYCSIHHATNVGSMFRPDNPLLPNYKHLPIGYHGRASSIVPSGTDVRRPMGQTKADTDAMPIFEPVKLLDYEMEMGAFVGPGNPLGSRITMQHAMENIFGMVIVNDWSARDVQKWEYQPLGPFNAKNFATSISPWVVTMEALAPFREAAPQRAADQPPPLEYLQSPGEPTALNITVEVSLRSKAMRERSEQPFVISKGNMRDLYWTLPQMLVHHTSTGCNLRPGDLFATGTISGTTEASRGCLLERTWRGQNPIELPDGTTRKFLQDGDEVIMRAWAEAPGAARIGFGECSGMITPAQ